MSNPARNALINKTSHAGGLFAAVWRAKGMINASEDELKAISSSGDRLGTWSGYLVVAALFAEAILAAYPLSPSGQRIAGFVINAVIALAVWGEIHFHGRSSDALNERLHRSNKDLEQLAFDSGFTQEKLEQAVNELAQTKRELGNAIERAANAERETERLRERTAWRTLDMETARALKDALAEMPPGNVALVHGTNDWESRNLAGEMASAFRNAGWTATFVSAGYAGEPIYGIRIPPIAPNNEREIPARITAAFEKAGIPFIPGAAPRAFMTTDSEHRFVRPTEPFGVVYVGPKHMLHPE